MSRKKILVVDDEVDFVEIIKKRLEASDCEVITANNGKDALERVRKDKPDAIFLDVMMPELDGLSVLKEIRAKDARTPVFIITAFSNEERTRTASSLNASGFIIKGRHDLESELENIKKLVGITDKPKKKNG